MRICFVGHAFHRRTGSSRFMIELLRGIGEVTEFYGDPDAPPGVNDRLVRDLAASRFDRYIYWQSELIAERLSPLDLGASFIAPMYDTVAEKRDSYWLQFVDHRFLSFTRAHHERLAAIGCQSHHFQYFPDPGPKPDRDFGREPDAFFWRRRPGGIVDYPSVLAQCRALGIGRLHVHDAPDVSADRGAEFDINPEGVKVTVSCWLAHREELEAVAGRPHVYFAPRLREGIGMACLEAMARGQIVVAPDMAATNEYVAHLTSGLLYDPALAAPYGLPRLTSGAMERMSRAARRKAVEGRVTWLADVDRLKSIIAGDGRRWSTSDASAAFGKTIRRAAHERCA